MDTEAEQVSVHRRSTPTAPRYDVQLTLSAGERLSSPMLPGFELGVAELFDRS